MTRNAAELSQKESSIDEMCEKGGLYKRNDTNSMIFEVKFGDPDKLVLQNEVQQNFNAREIRSTGFFVVFEETRNKIINCFLISEKGDLVIPWPRFKDMIEYPDFIFDVPCSEFETHFRECLVDYIAHNPEEAKKIPLESYDMSLGEEILTKYQEIVQEENRVMPLAQDRSELIETAKHDVEVLNTAFNEAEKTIQRNGAPLPRELFERKREI